MFHRLDKDQGGTLTLREFVFGMNENPTLPSAISLDDLWKFARQFDGDGDGTIDANEYRDFIDNLKPIHEPKHTHFQCVFPDTFCMSEGQFTHWFSQGHDNTFSTRGLPDKVKPMRVCCFAPRTLRSQDDARTHKYTRTHNTILAVPLLFAPDRKYGESDRTGNHRYGVRVLL